LASRKVEARSPLGLTTASDSMDATSKAGDRVAAPSAPAGGAAAANVREL